MELAMHLLSPLSSLLPHPTSHISHLPSLILLPNSHLSKHTRREVLAVFHEIDERVFILAR